MSLIYLYVFLCDGTSCDMNRFPMRDLDTCTKFAATYKASFPDHTTENEHAFAVFCAGPHEGYYGGNWFSRGNGQKDKKP